MPAVTQKSTCGNMAESELLSVRVATFPSNNASIINDTTLSMLAYICF